MDFNEFYNIAKEVGCRCLDYPERVRKDEPNRWARDPKGKQTLAAWEEDNKHEAQFSAEWRIGGQGGGSCWDEGESRHHPLTAEPEAKLDAMDDLLMRVCPNLPFLVYRKLENTLIHTREHTSNDYYGNYTEYSTKFINLAELYDFLVESNVI